MEKPTTHGLWRMIFATETGFTITPRLRV